MSVWLCMAGVKFHWWCAQAPEDGTDVVTAAKRVITEPGLNTLGLKDKRDITRLVAQSALQVCPTSLHNPYTVSLLLLLSVSPCAPFFSSAKQLLQSYTTVVVMVSRCVSSINQLSCLVAKQMQLHCRHHLDLLSLLLDGQAELIAPGSVSASP